MTGSAWYFAAYCYMAVDGLALLTMSLCFAIMRSEDPAYRAFFPGALITIAGAAYFVHGIWLIGDWIPGAAFPWPRLVGDVAIAIIAVRRVVDVLKLKARIRGKLGDAMASSRRAAQAMRRR